jgi:hypothetical protein
MQEQQPGRGDFLNLGGERHTVIDIVIEKQPAGYLIETNTGEHYVVQRDPANDNQVRRAWKLDNCQS